MRALAFFVGCAATLAAAVFSTSAVAAPAVVVSPAAGHPKIATQVSGTGFSANEAVDVYFDATDEFLAVTNGSGAFANHGLIIPKDALPGTHWITAVGRQSGDATQKSFNVRTDWTKFAFDAQHRGRNPYENVIDASNVGTLDTAWSYATNAGIQSTSSPIVYLNTIYFGSDDHKLYALTTKGAVKWTAATGGAIDSTPTAVGTTVYVGSADDKVYAYDWATGALKWSAATGGPINSSPVVVGNTLYIGSQDDKVYALNATTGATIWSTATGGPIYLSSPAVLDDIVYIGSTDDKLYALNASTGAVLWSYPTGAQIFGSAAVANGVVYFGSYDAKVYALDSRYGSLVWSYTTGGFVETTPSVVNGTVFAADYDGKVYALDAISGAFKWSATLDGSLYFGSIALASGVAYVGCTCHNVYGLDLKTGARLWGAYTRNSIYTTPAVANGMVYVMSNDGSLYAYALDAGNNAAYKPRPPPSYASLHPDHRLKPLKLSNRL